MNLHNAILHQQLNMFQLLMHIFYPSIKDGYYNASKKGVTIAATRFSIAECLLEIEVLRAEIIRASSEKYKA